MHVTDWSNMRAAYSEKRLIVKQNFFLLKQELNILQTDQVPKMLCLMSVRKAAYLLQKITVFATRMASSKRIF
jgi:hypothetical protein